MAYVIAEPCIGTKDTACVDVCPVDCIHPRKDEPEFAAETQLYIHPTECIDSAAIDAFGGMDVKLCFCCEFRLILARMNAVHRANVHAGGVFCADAGLGDHVSHSRSPFSNFRPGLSVKSARPAKKSLYHEAACSDKRLTSLYAGGLSFSTGRAMDRMK